MINQRKTFCVLAGLAISLALATAGLAKDTSNQVAKRQSLALIVMDPLAKELACACVRRFAQRNYHTLATHLSREICERLTVRFSEDLVNAIPELDPGHEAIVVAKHSVVTHDADAAGFKYRSLCRLTGEDGSTTLTGYFVAKMNDPAMRIADLASRRVLFGSANADEKYSAALTALKAAGVPVPKTIETRAACSDAGMDIVDSQESPPPVGVIFSFALALLEGCETIKKGDLKVIGHTVPVPFVTVFC